MTIGALLTQTGTISDTTPPLTANTRGNYCTQLWPQWRALSVLDAAHWATNRHMNWHPCVMRHLRNQQTMTWRTCGSNCSANRVAVLLDNVSDQRTSLCDVALNLSRDNVDRERETKDMSHCTSTSQSMTLQRQSNDVTDISVWRQNIRFLVFVSPTLIARLWRGWCQIDGQIVVYAPAV